LGVAWLELNQVAAAERALMKALITGGAELPVTHYYLAQIYWRRGDSAAAERALKTYLAEAPKGEQAAAAQALLQKLATAPPTKRQP
jgi:Tfp pilus assembly protein FimV